VQTTTIGAIAHALPTERLTNETLVGRFGEKAMQSIAKMTGIRERRIAAGGQCASDLGEAAARRLIAAHGVEVSEIDLLIFVSQTPDYRMPATASVLHGRMGLPERCSAFDINQACASYLHSLQVAHSMVVAGASRRALVVNADVLSKVIHPEDRTMVPLTGDAGTATLIVPSDASRGGFEHFRICNEGSSYKRLYMPAGGVRCPSTPETARPFTGEDGITRSLDTVYMDGPAVFHFAIHKVSRFLRDCLDDWGLSTDDIDSFLLHQANKTMVDLIYKALRIAPEKQFLNLQEIGNAACASLPALLSDAWRQGVVKPGSRTLLCGFGGGLSWGAATIKWPDDANPAVFGDVDTPAPKGSDGTEV